MFLALLGSIAQIKLHYSLNTNRDTVKIVESIGYNTKQRIEIYKIK